MNPDGIPEGGTPNAISSPIAAANALDLGAGQEVAFPAADPRSESCRLLQVSAPPLLPSRSGLASASSPDPRSGRSPERPEPKLDI